MALQWRRAISIVVGPGGNRIDKTSESLRAHADGDQLIFNGSLLPFDTGDGRRERQDQ